MHICDIYVNIATLIPNAKYYHYHQALPFPRALYDTKTLTHLQWKLMALSDLVLSTYMNGLVTMKPLKVNLSASLFTSSVSFSNSFECVFISFSVILI